MLLKVQTPFKAIVKKKIANIIAENLNGFFGIYPRHIDFTTKLVPSILTYQDEQGEGYVVIDEGILVKQGDTLEISTRDAFESRNLGELHETMKHQMEKQREEEEQVGLQATKLELGIVKNFYDLTKSKA